MGTLLIDKMLQTVCTQKASDLHLTVGSQPVVRLHGHMRPLATKVLESPDTVALMKSITPERCQQELQEVGGTDFGFAFGDMARFRVAVYKQRGNIGLVLRRVPNEFLTFQQLGLPAVIEQLIQRPRGLILVTGPTGSGKTTSLASMINWINDNMDRHIITIEDPIEYFHKHAKSLVNQREIGIDVPDFPEAIRRALRMDPDITAAETGHIVFGTLHTNSAEGTVNRIIDVFPKEQQDQIRTQLSVAIIGILAQALLPRKPKGLLAAYEMLVITPAISNLIRENKTYRIDSSIQTGRKHGMILLDDNLFNLWRQGLVEETEVMYKSRKPNELRDRIENAKKGIFDDMEDAEEDEEEVKKK